MSKTVIILVAVIVLAIQFALIVPATMNDTAFRRQERLEAHKLMADNPTSANQLTFQREMDLEQYHRTHSQLVRGLLYFCALTVFEGMVFYFFFQQIKQKRTPI